MLESNATSDPLISTVSKLAEFELIKWGYHQVDIDLIVAGKYQPRKAFSQHELQELADSMIATGGNSQAVNLRPIGGGRFELVAGERRWRAAQIAGISKLNALVSDIPDRLAMIMAVVENLQRQDLNPMEEAEGFQRMSEEGGLTHADIAAASGKSRTFITNSIRLTNLDTGVKDLLRSGKLSSGHGKVIAGIEDRLKQRAVAKESVKQGWSARQIESVVAKIKTGTTKPPPQTKDKDIARLEELISEKLGFPCSIATQTNGKVQMTIRFADNSGFYNFLEQQKLVDE